MIDITKLTNAVKKDGKVIAQCPACAATGADKSREHLVVFETGQFGCVVNPGNKEHNSEILKLVGSKSKTKARSLVVPIKRQVIPEITVLMEIKRTEYTRQAPPEASAATQPTRTAPQTPIPSPAKGQSNQQIIGAIQHGSNTGASVEEAQEFLRQPNPKTQSASATLPSGYASKQRV